MSLDLTIETATYATWQIATQWAAQESWELGDGDAERFLEVDPEGFKLGVVGGVPVAALSIARIAETYAHLGHYLVDRKYRGRGAGLETWRRCIAMMPHDLLIGLDGMPSQVANYEKWGFTSQYLTHRMAGTLSPSKMQPMSEHLGEVAEDLIDFDSQCVGYRRKSLLRRWFMGPGRLGFVARNAGQIAGFIGARASTSGIRIGPLHAVSDLVAQQLIADVCAAIPHVTPAFIDVPDHATSELEFLRSVGFSPIFHTHRMYRGTAPNTQVGLVRAVASLELG